MSSRFEKGLTIVSACLATAFVSLWLPAENLSLRAGITVLVFWLLATPVFRWTRFWLLPVGAAVAAAVALIPTSGYVQLVVPLIIGIALLFQLVWKSARSNA